MEKQNDIVETGVAELKFQHTTDTQGNNKVSENYQNLVRAFLPAEQGLEDAVFDSLLLCTIENGAGVPLDRVGMLVGESRIGLNGIPVSDAIYKENIAIRKKLNIATGTWEDFLTACHYLISNEIVTKYRISSSNTMIMNITLYGTTLAMDADILDRIKDLFRTVKCAEVQLNLSYTHAEEVFGWNADPDPNVRGFGVGQFAHFINA